MRDIHPEAYEDALAVLYRFNHDDAVKLYDVRVEKYSLEVWFVPAKSVDTAEQQVREYLTENHSWSFVGRNEGREYTTLDPNCHVNSLNFEL